MSRLSQSNPTIRRGFVPHSHRPCHQLRLAGPSASPPKQIVAPLDQASPVRGDAVLFRPSARRGTGGGGGETYGGVNGSAEPGIRRQRRGDREVGRRWRMPPARQEQQRGAALAGFALRTIRSRLESRGGLGYGGLRWARVGSSQVARTGFVCFVRGISRISGMGWDTG
jgi:hypothetical protein